MAKMNRRIQMDNTESVYRASLHLVRHFKDCLERDGKGFHSRVFNYFLHPEGDFVGAGQSQEVINGEPVHPEHVVPCAVLIEESCRLLEKGVSETEIARLLSKHWKIAYISKAQAAHIDSKEGLNLKNSMPDGWHFESGDTYERLKRAGITLHPLDECKKP
ncbi:MAG: hypothetical protein OEW36_05960 [Hylemonella sp.]|nr:hypothetical protein [Hylemonella sp.]